MKTITIWLKIAVFNFLIVALLGLLMRYKIAFSFPIADQKHLQEAHSHFAFYGWITAAIYALILYYFPKDFPQKRFRKFTWLMTVNLVAAYGMLFAFLYNGYFWLSIVFSTVSLLTSFGFYFALRQERNSIIPEARNWLLTGLVFAMLSSLGVFALSYMMMSEKISQTLYLASTYYYLHFQYNGFFIFSAIGFLMLAFKRAGVEISPKTNRLTYNLLTFGTLIGYGLSVLYMDMPVLIFGLIVIASFAQTVAAFNLFRMLKDNWTKLTSTWPPVLKWMLILAGLAFIVKILLQLGSNIPAVNQFAFGFRNVVIAYLHLVLLMCVSLFLLLKIIRTGIFSINKTLTAGLYLLMVGILLNEIILGVIGVLSIKYISLPNSQYMLLGAAVLMFVALILIYARLKKTAE